LLFVYSLVRNDNPEKGSLDRKEQEHLPLPVNEAPVTEEHKSIVQEKDTLTKSVPVPANSIKRNTTQKKQSPVNTMVQSATKDTLSESSEELPKGGPVRADSVTDPIRNKVRVNNGNQTIYEQDQQELEKKLMERYYHRKK